MTGAETVEDAAGDRKRRISRRGFHAFRHGFTTECARGGVPIGQIREWIGHQSTQITEIYEHWKEDDSQQRILDALPVAELPAAPLTAKDRLAALVATMTEAEAAEALELLESDR